ncbi:P-loop containing nucleoside triphosphate hydrolase protein [Aspergillus heterothallicus]
MKELDPKNYRRGLAYVSLDPVLYSEPFATTSCSAAMGMRISVTGSLLKHAKTRASMNLSHRCHRDGIATVVDSRGIMLSRGQKQRIAIARDLTRNPRVLLLDEATSTLDSTSANLIHEALGQASKGRTTITVTYNLGTV